MFRKSMIAAVAFLSALPAFAHNTQIPSGQFQSSASAAQPVLRLMNDREFSNFLERLDADMLRSEAQLKKMDMKSLSADTQEKQDLETSYNRCLQTLDSTREEIQKLSQKQTLKLDLFLLIDLNELARNLDALDEVLLNPAAANRTSGAHQSLVYGREVLSIDGALAPKISTFQHHFIAFTGVIDASLEQTDADAAPPSTEK
jgi:hypothetical protein